VRRSFVLAAPVAAGVLTLALAAAYPASNVHGSGLTGPKPPQSMNDPQIGSDYRVGWNRTGSRLVIGVRDGRACRPRLESATSTAPARVEVRIDRPTGSGCALAPRWWSIDVRPPLIRARSQGVHLLIDGLAASAGRPGGPAPRKRAKVAEI
jgi:hypothetical protein